MAEDSVPRTASVPLLGGFAGHHNDDTARRPAAEQDEAEAPPRRCDDEVLLRADAVAAVRLLRERVLAQTRERFGLGALQVPAFAEMFEAQAVEVLVSRLLSDQNQLVGHAGSVAGATRQGDRIAAFAGGLSETRELLEGAAEEVLAVIDAVEVEYGRRMAPTEPEPDDSPSA